MFRTRSYVELEKEVNGINRIYFDSTYKIQFHEDEPAVSVKLIDFKCDKAIRTYRFEVQYNYTRLYKRGQSIICNDRDILKIKEIKDV